MSARRRFRLRLAVAAAACALLAPAAPAAAGDMPSKRYRDPNAKFSFRIFDDWDPVPVETQGQGISFGGTDKYTVVKYMQRGAEKRGVEAAQLHAFRMGQGAVGQETGSETTPSGGEDPFTKHLKELLSKEDPKSMKELFDKVLDNYGFGGILDPKTAKDLKSKDGVPGKTWTMERKPTYFPPSYPNHLLVFAAWKKGDMELGLWMYCPGGMKRKFEAGFAQVAKTFMFFDPQAEDVKSLDVLKDLPISARKKRQIERGLVKGWDVLVSPKKNYIVIFNTKGRRNNVLARIISERIEAIREQVYETRFPAAAKVQAISIVRICGDQSEYRAYGGPGGSAGYWSSDTEELVFYDASPRKEPDDDTLAVLYHEAFHQYIYYSVGKLAPHSWFNEGTGDYFAGSRYSGGKFSIRPFNWRIDTIKEAIRKGPCPIEETKDRDGGLAFKYDHASHGYTPLKGLVRMTQRDYYDENIGVNYAQGWSFIYFLREAVPKNPKWNEKWGKILDTYFEVLKREANKDSPLAPPKADPDDPGMDDPGMDDPGMDDPGMDDPGMGDPGMDDPGMDDPGMGDPEPPGGDEMGIPTISSRFSSSSRALTAAVDAAFKLDSWTDADWEEIETAWKASTLKVH